MSENLDQKKILLGITGGISAYKSADLARKLIKAGAKLKVVMTKAACAFITPLTFQMLTNEITYTNLLDSEFEAQIGHIKLAKWADIILIAPASADFITRLTYGHANDLLSTICLASKAKVILVPAMNKVMWQNQATQANVQKCLKREILFLGPDKGEQACGDVGLGRMLEPEIIIKKLNQTITPKFLQNLHIMITAGSTQENIDPVRYITNHSSGKMGYALANIAVDMGAKVTLISGKSSYSNTTHATEYLVTNTEEMYQKVHELINGVNIFIGCAAVSDFRVADKYTQKLKKNTISDDFFYLPLILNKDILLSVSQLKIVPYIVGFAAETENLIENATNKLKQKKLDMVIANDVSDPTIGFKSNDNAVTIITQKQKENIPKTTKIDLAFILLKKIYQHYQQINSDKI